MKQTREAMEIQGQLSRKLQDFAVQTVFQVNLL